MPTSVFLDFTLPNASSWFYFSLFLAVSLFFNFSRPFTLRNWDLLAMFLFVPGFLLVQEAHQLAVAGHPRADRARFVGYVWLLSGSGYWFVRCLLDLTLGRRPLPAPNLTTPALIFFGLSLFVCLSAVAYGRRADAWEPVGTRPPAITQAEQGATAVVQEAQGGDDLPEARFVAQRTLAMGCHFAAACGLFLVAARRFGDTPTGATAAALYLLLPYTAYHIGQVHHVWPAALVVWAVYFFRSPGWAGGLLGVAAGTTFFPVLLAPAWAQFYAGRGLSRFGVGLVAGAAVGAGLTVAVALFNDIPTDWGWPTVPLTGWEPWKAPATESIWSGAHWAYRLPVFILYAGFVLASFGWPPVRDLGDLIAVSAAVLIGIQFWHGDRGGLYVLWYAPLLILLVMRPHLAEVQPPAPGPLPAFVRWAAGWVGDRWPTAPRPDPTLAA